MRGGSQSVMRPAYPGPVFRRYGRSVAGGRSASVVAIASSRATRAWRCRLVVRRATCIPRRNAASGVSLRSTRCATSRATRRMRSVSEVSAAPPPAPRPVRRSSRSSVLLGPRACPRAHGSTSASGRDGRIDAMADPSHRAAVVTVSDGVSNGTREDASGDAAEALLRAAGFDVSSRVVVPDERAEIERVLRELTAVHGLVVTTGGTGFGPRDVTPEATKAVVEREAPGLAELMRTAGLDPHADGGVVARGRRERRLVADRQPPRQPEGRRGGPGSHPPRGAARGGSAGRLHRRAPHRPRRRADVGVIGRSVGRTGHRDDHRREADRGSSLPGRGAHRDRAGRSARGNARMCGVRCRCGRRRRETHSPRSRPRHTPRCSTTTSGISRCSSSRIRSRLRW